jgi:DNA polymerase-1
MSKLIAIDGHSVAFRSFYALPLDKFTNKKGQPTNVVYGFLNTMLGLLEDHNPTHLVVAFDLSRKSFRTEMYPEYKGTRDKTPDEFISQLAILKNVLTLLNIKYIEYENYEADDILASVAKMATDAKMENFVVSGDRDTFQLISEYTKVLYPNSFTGKMRIMDDEAVFEKYGVHSYEYQDLAALVGETSDNIIGVPGVGKGFASKWIQQYGNIAGIYEHLDEIGFKRAEALKENYENVLFNRKLNSLVRDLKLPYKLETMEIDKDANDEIYKVFNELEFGRGIRNKIENYFIIADKEPKPELKVDTKDCNYLFAHAGQLVEQITDSEQVTITYDFKELMSQFLLEPSNYKNLFDIKLAAYIDETELGDYSIEGLAKHYLDFELAPENKTIADDGGFNFEDPDSNVDDLTPDPKAVKQNYIQAIVKLHNTLAPIVESEVDQQLLNFDFDISVILSKMHIVGIGVDVKKLQALHTKYTNKATGIGTEINKTTGTEVNLSSPKQLQALLFDKLGLEPTKKIKTGFSTSQYALEEIYQDTKNEILHQILQAKKLIKAAQIVMSLLDNIDADNRIRTTYENTSTATGRLSSVNPNLQNIPIKNSSGDDIRSCFSPGLGKVLLSADYSQIEMRILAGLSKDENLIEAFESGEDLHKFVIARINNIPVSEVTPEMRQKAKGINYGLIYGQSVFGLAGSLGVDNVEAKYLMDSYFERFSKIKPYLDGIVEKAKETGYTETILGRKCHIPYIQSNISNLVKKAERQALNAPIQGSAADLIKCAMLKIDKEFDVQGIKSKMCLQIHDELVFEVETDELEQVSTIIEDKMTNAFDLGVPIEVSIGTGNTLYDAAH